MVASGVFAYYFNGLTGDFEGTSIAAPLWAAFTAMVNQQAAASGRPAVGFPAPALYVIGGESIYNSCLHDTTVGNNFWPGSSSEFSAAVGYDLCTGWGSPNGAGLINELQNFLGPIYVDFNYTGTPQKGTFANPFNTLAQGVSAVSSEGTIILEGGGYSLETMTITKSMTIISIGGPTTVGNN